MSTATATRLALDTLPDITDAPALDAIRVALLACHASIRLHAETLRTEGAIEIANMLLISIEGEIDGIAASAFLLEG